MPEEAARERQQQAATEHRALDHAQYFHEVRRIDRVVDRRRAAREQHAPVVRMLSRDRSGERWGCVSPSARQRQMRACSVASIEDSVWLAAPSNRTA